MNDLENKPTLATTTSAYGDGGTWKFKVRNAQLIEGGETRVSQGRRGGTQGHLNPNQKTFPGIGKEGGRGKKGKKPLCGPNITCRGVC